MRTGNMSLAGAIGAGLGLGALTMYFMDPNRGRTRRALVRDKALHARNVAVRGGEVTLRDIGNRLRGIVAETVGGFKAAGHVPDDDVLVGRVRSHLGRRVGHMSRLEIAAHGGIVTLQGEMNSVDIPCVLSCVAGVRGVRSVENRMHARSSQVSAQAR